LASSLSVVQYTAAVEAAQYVSAALVEQGAADAAVADLVPGAFAGVASDGRDLVSLLDQPRIGVLTRIGQGMAPAQALAGGLAQLETITVTQVQDAGRAAEGAAIVTRPHVTGYVRHLNPPSCSRCAVLAGQFYRWNKGFKRHPKCDCFHVPVVTDEAFKDQRTSPTEYFKSLSESDQNRIFTNAGARAIRDGADLTAIVNARRGMATATEFGRPLKVTTEGTARRKGIRLMPESIYGLAGGDRDEAIRLLAVHGYVR
jgi:hypothetical protein